jgi:hypothetical protein
VEAECDAGVMRRSEGSREAGVNVDRYILRLHLLPIEE